MTIKPQYELGESSERRSSKTMALLDKFLLELTTAASVDGKRGGGGGAAAAASSPTSVASSLSSCTNCQISIVQDNARPHHQWVTQIRPARHHSFSGFELHHHQKLLGGSCCSTYDEKHMEEIQQHQKTRWSTTSIAESDGHQAAKFGNHHQQQHVSSETALHCPSRRSSLEFSTNAADHYHQDAKFGNNLHHHHVSSETALHRPSRRSSLEFNANTAGHNHQDAKFGSHCHHVNSETGLHRPSRRSSLEFNVNAADSSVNVTWDSSSSSDNKNDRNTATVAVSSTTMREAPVVSLQSRS